MTVNSQNGRDVSIHAFRGEGDRKTAFIRDISNCFNPRLPGGRRRPQALSCVNRRVFQSTPSGGKATRACMTALRRSSFQSTPSGGKATNCEYETYTFVGVSIHAFRGEGDERSLPSGGGVIGFNPRLPGGRRHLEPVGPSLDRAFQSTPSGGKAT